MATKDEPLEQQVIVGYDAKSRGHVYDTAYTDNQVSKGLRQCKAEYVRAEVHPAPEHMRQHPVR